MTYMNWADGFGYPAPFWINLARRSTLRDVCHRESKARNFCTGALVLSVSHSVRHFDRLYH